MQAVSAGDHRPKSAAAHLARHERQHNGKPSPQEIPELLRTLPLHGKRVVSRNSQHFGDLGCNPHTKTFEVNLNRVPTELPVEEKRSRLRCEWEGETTSAKFHDIDATACNYAVISTRCLGQSIGTHYMEAHSSPGHSYIATFTTRGKVR